MFGVRGAGFMFRGVNGPRGISNGLRPSTDCEPNIPITSSQTVHQYVHITETELTSEVKYTTQPKWGLGVNERSVSCLINLYLHSSA